MSRRRCRVVEGELVLVESSKVITTGVVPFGRSSSPPRVAARDRAEPAAPELVELGTELRRGLVVVAEAVRADLVVHQDRDRPELVRREHRRGPSQGVEASAAAPAARAPSICRAAPAGDATNGPGRAQAGADTPPSPRARLRCT